jgi:cathepsin A (carboxypeptidase C)
LFVQLGFDFSAHANVLFLDQPRTVGYSFGYGAGIHSSVEAATDFILFYQGFLDLFPEYVGRPLIIAGESYGGHYIPAFASAILAYNARLDAQETAIDFAGVAIGNGCINWTVQNLNSYIAFQHEHGLIPDSATPSSRTEADALAAATLGYTPNFYDYRLQSVTCPACYSYNYTAWSYWFLRPEVKGALGVCGDAGDAAFSGNAGGCVNLGNFDVDDQFDYSGALARTLEAGVPVTLYYGKTDTACDHVGGRNVADTLVWKSAAKYKAAAWAPISVMRNSSIALTTMGEFKSVDGLTVFQVAAAGHMVPIDQPVAAYLAIHTILQNLQTRRHPTPAPPAPASTLSSAVVATVSSAVTLLVAGIVAGFVYWRQQKVQPASLPSAVEPLLQP